MFGRDKESSKAIAKEIEETIKTAKPRETKPSYTKDDLLSSGSTLLNLACSDMIEGAYLLGSVVHIIGDSHAGKSLLCLTTMAEAVRDKRFNEYELEYGEYEAAMNFPIESMFGSKMNRLKMIPTKKQRLKGPYTAQDWHEHLIEIKAPFIQVTDSLDALTTMDELKDDRPVKGGWHTEKAIINSSLFPKIVGKVEATDSIFIIISQTRDNIGVTFGEKKTHSGGNAIKFYRSLSIWLAITGRIYKEVRGKKREIGAYVRAKVKKNKLTGKVRQVDFPVYYKRGVDDVQSMIEWMIEEQFWGGTKDKAKVNPCGDLGTAESEENMKTSELIKYIEENNKEEELRKLVGECWKELENEIEGETRKQRYT